MSPVPSCPTLCPAIPGVPSSSLDVGFAAWDEVSGTRALSTSCALAPAGIIFCPSPMLTLTPEAFLTPGEELWHSQHFLQLQSTPG